MPSKKMNCWGSDYSYPVASKKQVLSSQAGKGFSLSQGCSWGA